MWKKYYVQCFNSRQSFSLPAVLSSFIEITDNKYRDTFLIRYQQSKSRAERVNSLTSIGLPLLYLATVCEMVNWNINISVKDSILIVLHKWFLRFHPNAISLYLNYSCWNFRTAEIEQKWYSLARFLYNNESSSVCDKSITDILNFNLYVNLPGYLRACMLAITVLISVAMTIGKTNLLNQHSLISATPLKYHWIQYS